MQIALQPLSEEGAVVVVVTDASGAPITDATVALEANMNHPGMAPVLADAVTDDTDGNADGRYRLPFELTMLGDWIVTVTVNQADGTTSTHDFSVWMSSDGIQGDNILPIESAAEGSLHIENAMARPAPLAGGTGAVYFLLHNDSNAPIRWIGGDSPAAAAVEIHTTENDNGVMRMRQITDGVEIAPGESVTLTPGGMHLMLVNLAAPLAKEETLKVTLHFEGADDLTFDVPVVAMDDVAADGEMEHDHN